MAIKKRTTTARKAKPLKLSKGSTVNKAGN